MFNNLFDSFHNTVSEAKEEREQLDRLLMISTPRERLLVSVIAVLMVILAVWLVLGNVSRSLVIDGILVEPAGAVIEGDRSVQVLVWVENEAASSVRAGMPATVELFTENGRVKAFEGEITAVSAVPSADVLTPAALGFILPVTVRRVDIVLKEGIDLTSVTSRECRIIILVGGQSPVDLFRVRQP
ncbi:MAG: hypothetical protein OXI81_01550 [Paracoccaceae bacterium]|nr:hypothetical protein [Paracoccaceae bacterium]